MLTFVIALGVLTFHIFTTDFFSCNTRPIWSIFEQRGFFGYGSNEHPGPLERGYSNGGYVVQKKNKQTPVGVMGISEFI